MKPKHIILLRHGESQANVSTDILKTIPDYKVGLSDKGKEEARSVGRELKKLVGDARVLFYVSPYLRSVQTFEYLNHHSFSKAQIKKYVEPRLREQDFGNFQDTVIMKRTLQQRDDYGRFFYRFPEGESGADVYDRISTFMESIHRCFERTNDCEHVVIVSHGLTIRLFLMRWFHWTVEEFESYENPRNCEYYIMELGGNNQKLKYSLKTELRKYRHKKDQCDKLGIREVVPSLVWLGIVLVVGQYYKKLTFS